MFSITQGKGFHITFANGWTASVQWGPGNYCDNQGAAFGVEPEPSRTAEVAFYPAKGGLQSVPESLGGNGDTVAGYLNADQVVAFLLHVAAQEPQ